MTCEECVKASQQPWNMFRSDCQGCKARGLSRGPDFTMSRKAGRQSEAYRHVLGLLGLSHDEVKTAFKMDAMNRKEGE